MKIDSQKLKERIDDFVLIQQGGSMEKMARVFADTFKKLIDEEVDAEITPEELDKISKEFPF